MVYGRSVRVMMASLALHLALLYLLPSGSAIAGRERGTEISVEFLEPIAARPAEPSTPHAPTPTPNSSPVEPATAPSMVRGTDADQSAPSEATPNITLPNVEPSSGNATTNGERVPAYLLDPSRVAAQQVFGQETMPTGGSHGNLRNDTGPTVAETLRRLEGELHAEAVTKTYTQRTRANLRRRGDGSYLYQGHAFAATITPDGDVRFSDRGGFDIDPAAGQARFDLTDALMRGNGQDPYAAERQWFMDQTESLREQLEDAALVRRRAEGLRRIRGRLSAIWNHSDREPTLRRRQIFEVWAEMAEGDEGAAGRQEVLAWIRETLPAGDPEAFTVTEIVAFNRGRVVRFVPYL